MSAAPSVKKRCGWAGSDPLYVRYHDEEWGRPVHDDRRLFEMLTLEGARLPLRRHAICYAFMQACGLVDDHAAVCFRARR